LDQQRVKCRGTVVFLAMKRLTSLLRKRQPCHYLALSQLLGYLSVRQEKLSGPGLRINTTEPGGVSQENRHGKLFIGRLCKKRVDDLLKLSRHQLKMVVAILKGRVPVRKHLRTMGLFEGDPTCRFCRKEAETVQHILCGCKALARQRYKIFGYPFVEPKDINTASVRNLCLFISTGLLNL
jgi:hypothetical protein